MTAPSAVGVLREVVDRIVRDAVPATRSSQTWFVPRYQLDQLKEAADAALASLEAAEGWRPIESAPKEAPFWLVWSALYGRPVVVTCRQYNNTYWDGDWDFDVQATHWKQLTPPAAASDGEGE